MSKDSPIQGQEIGDAICKALGIDSKKVISVGLRVAVGEVVLAEITQQVTEQEGKELVEVLGAYRWEKLKSLDNHK